MDHANAAVAVGVIWRSATMAVSAVGKLILGLVARQGQTHAEIAAPSSKAPTQPRQLSKFEVLRDLSF